MRSLPQGELPIGSRPQNRADSPDASGSILLARAASTFRSAFLLWYPKSLPSLGAWGNRLRGVFVATDYPLGQDRASPGLVRHASYVGRMANLEKENAARPGAVRQNNPRPCGGARAVTGK